MATHLHALASQRERPPRRASAAAADAVFARVSAPEPEAEDPLEDPPAGPPADEQPQPKRKRGRPRKVEAPRQPGEALPDAGLPQPKRKRGRPRKVSLPPADMPSEGEGEAASAGLLPGSALPSLGLPKVPSALMPTRLSSSADLFAPMCRRALHACSCIIIP